MLKLHRKYNSRFIKEFDVFCGVRCVEFFTCIFSRKVRGGRARRTQSVGYFLFSAFFKSYFTLHAKDEIYGSSILSYTHSTAL